MTKKTTRQDLGDLPGHYNRGPHNETIEIGIIIHKRQETRMEPKYPQIVVQLTGNDGNAFGILGQMIRALREAGVSEDERKEFTAQATSGDYDNLLQVCLEWVTVL